MECAVIVLKNIVGFACMFLVIGVGAVIIGLLTVGTAILFGLTKDSIWLTLIPVAWGVIGAGTITGVMQCWSKS